MTDIRSMYLFRDQQVALDFQKMAAEGYIDTEFTMYGITCYQNGERHYLVSSDETRILDAIEKAIKKHMCVLPLQSLTETCPVPLGEKEMIAHDVKIHLAKRMQLLYPSIFLEQLQTFFDEDGKDWALPALANICKKTANTFSAERLVVVESLIVYAYQHKALSHAGYRDLCTWLEKEKENLQDDIIPKDIHCKTWYTLTYEDHPGHMKQLYNASREWTHHKKEKLESEGKIVAPIYSHTYWYNNETTVTDLRTKHAEHCKALLDEDYFQIVRSIASFPPAVDQKRFNAFLAECTEKYGHAANDALQAYGRYWRVC